MVGMTAYKMTTVTRMVYWLWLMILLFSPKSVENVPKVSPVDMSRVV